MTFWALGEIVKAQAGHPRVRQLRARAREAAASRRAVRYRPGRRGLDRRAPASAGRPRDATTARDDRRDEAFTAWRRFLEAIADERPLVLVFEDLHWADDALLDFVDHLVDWASGVPLLVLCAARPELLTRRPGWGGGKVNSSTILALALSTTRRPRRSCTSCSARSAIEADLQTRLLEHAGGNPLYAEEFTRMLLERPGDVVLPETRPGHHRRASRHAPPRGEGTAPGRRRRRQGLLARRARRGTSAARGASALARAKGVRKPKSPKHGRRRGRVRVPSRARPRRLLRADPKSRASREASIGGRVDRVARPSGGSRRDARPPLRGGTRVRGARQVRTPSPGRPRPHCAQGSRRPCTRAQRIPGRRALLRQSRSSSRRQTTPSDRSSSFDLAEPSSHGADDGPRRCSTTPPASSSRQDAANEPRRRIASSPSSGGTGATETVPGQRSSELGSSLGPDGVAGESQRPRPPRPYALHSR